MKFVDHVPDHVVTGLVYLHMPSWFAVACYFDWRKHYALKVYAEQRAKAVETPVGKLMQRGGAVLTDEGWVLPTGPLNPRVIDQPGEAVLDLAAQREQEHTDAEVDDTRVEHEQSVLAEDIWLFATQWDAVITQTQKTRRRLLAARGRSEEREAYMVRWNAENGPH